MNEYMSSEYSTMYTILLSILKSCVVGIKRRVISSRADLKKHGPYKLYSLKPSLWKKKNYRSTYNCNKFVEGSRTSADFFWLSFIFLGLSKLLLFIPDHKFLLGINLTNHQCNFC